MEASKRATAGCVCSGGWHHWSMHLGSVLFRRRIPSSQNTKSILQAGLYATARLCVYMCLRKSLPTKIMTRLCMSKSLQTRMMNSCVIILVWRLFLRHSCVIFLVCRFFNMMCTNPQFESDCPAIQPACMLMVLAGTKQPSPKTMCFAGIGLHVPVGNNMLCKRVCMPLQGSV